MSRQASILSFDQARSKGSQPGFRVPKNATQRKLHNVSGIPQSHAQAYRRNAETSQSRPLTYRSSTAQAANDRRRAALHGYTPHRTQEQDGFQNRASSQQTVTFVQSPAHSQMQTRVREASSEHKTNYRSTNYRSAQTSQDDRQGQKPKGVTDRVRHAVRAKKADRDFERYTQRTERNQTQEQTSRPALYNMQMGRTQKRSTRMQRESKSGINRQSVRKEARRSWWQTRTCIVIGALFFCAVMLYQPIANLYNETRSLQQLEAEYDALQANNIQVRANLDHLATDAGLEEYAHNELGWIRSDEHTARVADVAQPNQSTDQVKRVVTTIPEGSIKTPDTWYSPVLDVVFGYSG